MTFGIVQGDVVGDNSAPDREYTSDDWCTERALAIALGRFDTDPCSNNRSHIIASRTYALERGEDGLKAPWIGSVYWNGPYSNVMPWAERLIEYADPWCALVKLDPTTKWWRRLVLGNALWAPFRRRVRFERPDKSPLTANFPSALVWRDWTPPEALVEWLWMPKGAR